MKTIVRCLVVFLFAFLQLGSVVFAHDPVGEEDPSQKIISYQSLIEKVSQLEASPQREGLRSAIPFVKILGKKFHINSEFFHLTETFAQLYIEEIQNVCPQCELPRPEEINREVKDLVAKGWLSQIGKKALSSVAIRYGSEFIHLGARYGAMAGMLKVTGELVEDALLVIFKMPGAHFLCEVITTAIAYYSRTVLSTLRASRYAKHFGKNGIMNIVRTAATSWVVSRALRKIHLDIGPIEVDSSLFDEKDIRSEGRHELIEELSEKSRMRKFIDRIAAKSEFFYKKISELERKRKKASAKEKHRIDKQILKLRRKLSNQFTLSRKVFESRRRGATLWLVKRKGFYQNEGLHSLFRGTRLWMVSLTDGILNPSLTFSEERKQTLSSFKEELESTRLKAEANSSIDKLLLSEAQSKGLDSTQVQRLFQDIDILFDQDQSRRARSLHLAMLEGFLGEFMPKLIRKYISLQSSEMTEGELTWKNTKKVVSLQWNIGRITYFVDDFVDYLRMATVVKGKRDYIFERNLAKDYLLRVFESYKVVSQLKPYSKVEDLDSTIEKTKKKLFELDARRFWLEKKAAHSLLPIKETFMSLVGLSRYGNSVRKKVTCSKIYF